MTFKSGESGNPTGRPRGAVSKRLQLSRLLEHHSEALINKAVELAKNGDVNALRLCIERLVPKPKDELVQFNLPETDLGCIETLLHLGGRVITAVASGNLTPEQGKSLSAILESQRKTIETVQLVERVKAIELALKHRHVRN